MRRKQDWVIVSIAIPDESFTENEPYPFIETSNILAHQFDDGSWVSALRFTCEYAELIDQAPDWFLHAKTKAFLLKNPKTSSLKIGEGYMGSNYYSNGLELFYTPEELGINPNIRKRDPSVDGIDVSHWNPNINWYQVYNAGYRFAFVKATEGNGWVDPDFITNMTNGKNDGMFMGAYHFARPDLNTNAALEANYFVSIAGPYISKGYLRPVLDIERHNTLGQTALSNWVHTWMDTVKNATGVEPLWR